MTMMTKEQILNTLISKHNFHSYLEIGIQSGHCFTQINCENKSGVDPNPAYKSPDIFVMTSDEYFESIPIDDKYDLIFIDGLHLEKQVDKDIKNSLMHLSDNGLIVLHDCNPVNVYDIRENYYDFSTPSKSHWNGTVYKSIIKLRYENPNVFFYTVDTDEGCGIIDPTKSQELFVKDGVSCEDFLNDFELFCSHKKEILNLITPGEFLTMLKGE
jgi:hypothetical protein